MRKLHIIEVVNKYKTDGISRNNTRLHSEISTVIINEGRDFETETLA
jgi:hypothetical protein